MLATQYLLREHHLRHPSHLLCGRCLLDLTRILHKVGRFFISLLGLSGR